MNEFASQAQNWIFENYEHKFHENFESAKTRLEAAWKQEQELDSVTIPHILTNHETRDLLSWYTLKIRDYVKFFKLNQNVEATAILLFRRFYLRASPFENDPKKILMTSIFMASKVEHQPMVLADFLAKIPKSPTPTEMVNLEVRSVS
jgi:cyclin H